MAKDYKAQKEAFVSNLTGGTVWEINSVVLVASSAILLWSVLQSRLRLFTPYSPPAALIDFLLNCAAILSATTIYSSAPLLLNAFLLLPAAFSYFTSEPKTKQTPSRPPVKAEAGKDTVPDPLPVKPFITHYRGSMIVVTCAAILAVDFRIFPRRFGKVENWGTSLMDLGVGSFVFSSGVVSARSVLKDQIAGKYASLSRRLLDSMRHSFPLLVLGFIRLASVKGLDYAEHVSEYGVHWNFFFTLGLLPPFVAIFQSAFQVIPSYAALSCLLGVAYELALNFTDLKAFILTAPRTDLLSQNREGVFSFIGYLAIFLAGQAAGHHVLPRQPPIPRGASKAEYVKRTILGRLVTSAVAWSALYYFSTSYYGPGLAVSRRLANLPYFLWVAAFNCGQIALCCATEALCFPDIHKATDKATETRKCKDATSRVLHSFNRNGLVVFLVANLLTGLVNMTLPTLHMGAMPSMAVLVAYISAVSMIALGLDWRNISIKL